MYPSLFEFPATSEVTCESGTARTAERRPEKAETTSGLDLASALVAVQRERERERHIELFYDLTAEPIHQ